MRSHVLLQLYGADLFIPGNLVCCVNLMDKSRFRNQRLPIVEASNETTYFTNRPGHKLHQAALKQFTTARKVCHLKYINSSLFTPVKLKAYVL